MITRHMWANTVLPATNERQCMEAQAVNMISSLRTDSAYVCRHPDAKMIYRLRYPKSRLAAAASSLLGLCITFERIETENRVLDQRLFAATSVQDSQLDADDAMRQQGPEHISMARESRQESGVSKSVLFGRCVPGHIGHLALLDSVKGLGS